MFSAFNMYCKLNYLKSIKQFTVKCAGEPEPGSELPPAARRAAWETESLPAVMASGPIPSVAS
jgi:hypothetical protein